MIKNKNIPLFFSVLIPLGIALTPSPSLSLAETRPGTEDAVLDDLTLYDDQMADRDPFEPLNRGVFVVNTFLDGLLLRPMAYAYEDLVPDVVKNRFSGVLNNLGAPIIFLNDLLQGEGQQAMNTLGRFFVNTVFGFLGLFDVASEIGLDRKSNDFDTTFRRWGIGAGPYIVLPLFGPSSFRNLVGDAAEYLTDPYNMYMRTHYRQKFLGTKGGKQIHARSGVRSLVKRHQVLNITDKLDTTEDPYAQYRILYMQNRKIIDAIEESAVPDDLIDVTQDEPTVKITKN